MKKILSCFDNTTLTARLLPVSAISLALAVTGCASTSDFPKRLEFERSPQAQTSSVFGEEQVQRKYSETDTPATPRPRTGNVPNNKGQLSAIPEGKDDLNVAFNQMPIPTFIHAIYGSVLKANYSMDPAVASRTDLVTFRTSKPQSPQQMANLARLLLKSYGIAVQDYGGMIRIVPDNASTSYSPFIKRGRAQPDIPANLRPVFHYVELEAVRVADFAGFMRTMFGSKIQLTEDTPRNALILSGQSEDVSAALEAVQVFDQPAMRGQRSKRISPVFWTADEFGRKLTEILTAEGYAVGANASAGTPIIILPIAPLNSIIVFASSDDAMSHVLKWARELDRPSESKAGGTFFTYPVKYADAQALASTLSDLMSGGSVTAAVPASTSTGTATGAAPAATARRSSRIVVNNATNSLIIQGSGQDDYRQWMALLTELDRPTKSALIDVVVAEVTHDDTTELGIEWGFRNTSDGSPYFRSSEATTGVITGASGNFADKASGLTVNFLNSANLIKAKLNALEQNKLSRILSSPKIMARNGETATIQVGNEIPIQTSIQTTPNVSGNLTTTSAVQYRNTGIALKVRPVINSGNRIDLDITQEVSKAADSVGDLGPAIYTRKVDTKLSLKDGSSIILAGLISNDTNTSDNGVPLLKDIPGIGTLFKSKKVGSTKTELIILITPYIINDDFEAEAVTEAFQNSLGDWARELKEQAKSNKLKQSKTITRPSTGDAKPASVPNTRSGTKSAPEKSDKAPTSEPEAKVSEQEDRPSADSKNTPKEEKDDAEASGVIMSKPETSAAPSEQSSSNSKPVSKATNGASDSRSTTKVPNAPANGKPIADQNLLEELRRAVEKK